MANKNESQIHIGNLIVGSTAASLNELKKVALELLNDKTVQNYLEFCKKNNKSNLEMFG
jgi:hypothetical protein